MRLDFRNKGNGKPWGGLGKCPQFEKSLICDSPAGNYWWMCIGCQGWYPVSLNQTIPGPSNILVKRVQLYAEKVNIEVESCNTNNTTGAIFIFSLFYFSSIISSLGLISGLSVVIAVLILLLGIVLYKRRATKTTGKEIAKIDSFEYYY